MVRHKPAWPEHRAARAGLEQVKKKRRRIEYAKSPKGFRMQAQGSRVSNERTLGPRRGAYQGGKVE